jgi:hypothetical protein
MRPLAGPFVPQISPMLGNLSPDRHSQTHAESTQAIKDLLAAGVVLTKNASQTVCFRHLGPFTCRIISNDKEAGRFLTRCLVPAAVEPYSNPHLEISVLCGSSVPFASPPPWNLPHTDSRHLERLHLDPDGSISAYYDHDRRLWMMLDKVRGQGLIWIADWKDIPFWEEAAPFKTILSWFVADKRQTLVHGAIVADRQDGILLAGPGGSGKSTTVVACLQAGLGVCGDDLVMVEEAEKGWLAYAVYDAVKVSLEPYLPLPPILTRVPSRPCGTKRLFRYSDAAPGRLLAVTQLAALMQCVIVDSPTSAIIPQAASSMLRALAPPTAFLLRGRENQMLRKIGGVVRSLPCFRLELGNDPYEAASVIVSWLSERHK